MDGLEGIRGLDQGESWGKGMGAGSGAWVGGEGGKRAVRAWIGDLR